MKYVAYYRVSTVKQGNSGLGLEAQEHSVKQHVSTTQGRIIKEFTEVESGKKSNRIEIAKALEYCKKHKATLIIAKLDRLSRDLEFIAKLQNSKIEFICADMPEANKLTISMLAVMAQYEREMISKRTKEALARAKARGVKLGNKGNLKKANLVRKANAQAFANKMWPIIEPMWNSGLSQRNIVERLNATEVTSRLGGNWTLSMLQRVLNKVSTK